MIEPTLANSLLQKLDFAIPLDIVGALYLDNNYYSITVLNNYIENEVQSPQVTQVARFELNQQSYAILKIKPTSTEQETDPTHILTERELEIAILVALGKQNKHIAKQLKISEWTVSAHLRRIFTKLGVGSRAAMVYRCSLLINQNINSGS
jgi:DNA-binding NarL/FixJ family response regulator